MRHGSASAPATAESDEGIVQVLVPIDRETLLHFIEFEVPARAMGIALAEYVQQREAQGQREDEVCVSETEAAADGSDDTQELSLNGLREIERLMQKSPLSVGGYGVCKKAALLAVSHFGKGWLKKYGRTSEESKILRSLEHIVKSSVPAEHSNKYEQWSRFRRYARSSG